MRLPTELECLYIDFDAFFANAEKQLTPALRDRPVGVVPLPSDHTSLIACCYIARQYGVRRGMGVQEARALCPQIALPLARHDMYVRLHLRILEEIDKYLPVRKVWSIDEMECTLTGAEQENAVDLAIRLREGLRRHIGPWVTPSIGLAPNQFLAKVAAEYEKPHGLTVLHPDDLPGKLLTLDLTDLPGISRGMQARLLKAGIMTVRQLWETSPKQARQIWHSVEGERFWMQLHGYAVSRPDTQRRMFGHSRVLAQGWHTPDKARECLRLLTSKAARRLRRDGYMASHLDISVKGTSSRWTGTRSFPPARDDHTFLTHASDLFDAARPAFHRHRLKGVYVMLHGLSRPGEVSGDLFDQPANRPERLRWEQITDMMDGLNTRYGGGTISLGLRRELPGGYAGAKIAFGRVPDVDDFDLSPDTDLNLGAEETAALTAPALPRR